MQFRSGIQTSPKIQIEKRGLEDISKIGAGSMRDAQSLLDQVIAYSGKKVDAESVQSVLGIVGGNTLETFVDLLIDRQPAALVQLTQKIANQGKDIGFFCRSLMEYLRNILIVKIHLYIFLIDRMSQTLEEY